MSDDFSGVKAERIKSIINATNTGVKRVNWSLKQYGHLLVAAVKGDTSSEARELEKFPEEVIPQKVAALISEKGDPSRHKTYSTWLIGLYAYNGLRLRDLDGALEILMLFHLCKAKLPPHQRDHWSTGSDIDTVWDVKHWDPGNTLATLWERVSALPDAKDFALSEQAQICLEHSKEHSKNLEGVGEVKESVPKESQAPRNW
jgi:hypothetical protein